MNGQGMLNIKPTSEDTSDHFYLDSKEFSDTTSGWIPFDYPFHRLFSERVVFHTEDLNRMVCQRLVPNESAYLSKYQEHIYVSIPNQNYLVNSFKGAYSIYIFLSR